jgi:hypothetical protein
MQDQYCNSVAPTALCMLKSFKRRIEMNVCQVILCVLLGVDKLF